MVTSTKVAEDKVVAMSAEAGGGGGGGGGGLPPRTLLEEVNAHLTCVLCRGYYIDATTIVECLHSFCRSCIVKHLQTKKYCPVCEMMINAVKPNIKPDKALQDIVYKLVPGLFQREMERRQQFYSSRPGPAASTTPEQRGEDTERIIFSPEDVISFSLEYAEASDADSVSSRSSESGSEAGVGNTQQTRRYLQCPAVVNVSHLKKFLTMKFDIDCTHYCVDILYKRVPLPDYYTLMDIAYIYNWKRNEPMRFFYQIIDYTAIRSRFSFFDINRKGSHFGDRKASPTPTDASAGSPAPPALDPSSDSTSGTSSPMPNDSNLFISAKGAQDKSGKKIEKTLFQSKLTSGTDGIISEATGTSRSSETLPEVDVEKSQFLNSFELTAKNSSTSPVKCGGPETAVPTEKPSKNIIQSNKSSGNTCTVTKEDEKAMKRKNVMVPESTDLKLKKVDNEKTLADNSFANYVGQQPLRSLNTTMPDKKNDEPKNTALHPPAMNAVQPVQTGQKTLNLNRMDQSKALSKQVPPEQSLKRTFPGSPNMSSPKRKTTNEYVPGTTQASITNSSSMTPLPIKPTLPNQDSHQISQKTNELPKPNLKKLPELKLNMPNQMLPKSNINNKPQPMMNRGIRTDLLANNSDPITDRSKIMSQVKRSLSVQSPSDKSQVSGDPLKSLFDSCKINIPSSLSITLTDQKLDPRNMGDCGQSSDPNKFNKNISHNGGSGNFAMKSPTPAVQNSIEILKLPDLDPMKPLRPDLPNASAGSSAKTPDTPSAKGPVPSLKPISDTKLGKQSNFSKPSPTFHQIFIQSLQQPDKSKVPKNKAPVPKLMPANQKSTSESQQNEPNLISQSLAKTQPSENKSAPSSKSDSVLDLSTPHTSQSQLGPQQTKALETMQSIANLAKKQSFPLKPNSNKPLSNIPNPLRIPVHNNQSKPKTANSVAASSIASSRLESLQSNKTGQFRPSISSSPSSASPTNQASHQSSGSAQPSPRSQTRSPSSSPKLVIAEEKQTPLVGSDANQSNQISSSQISSTNTSKNDPSLSPYPLAGPSKPIPKVGKPPSITKPANVRFPSTPNKPPGTSGPVPGTEMLHSLAPQILAQQQAFMRQQYEMQSQMGHMLPATTEWINKLNQARHIENLMKSLSNVQQLQNDINKK